FNSTSNIVVGANTSDYENASGVDPTHVNFDNYKVLTSNISDVMFVNASGKDYHLSSLLSPVFDTYNPSPMQHWMSGYDFEGVRYSTNVAGAYSGYELMLENPPSTSTTTST